MSFLKAEWRKLLLANYIIDPILLEDYIPYKTELDLWQNRCYVSLVGFMFKNTRLLGFKIPYHVNFEEVNLRFYVKYKDGSEWKRGVVFIKEIVPRFALSFVANTIYGEHYQTLPMQHEWLETDQNRKVSYSWKHQQQWHKLSATAQLQPEAILAGSETEFITEHYWGYTQLGLKKTNEYQVTHPTWEIYPVLDYEINVDFGNLYDARFSFLSNVKPDSVMLAEGSEITVESTRRI